MERSLPMVFSKGKAIIYLENASALSLYNDKGERTDQLTFPKDLIKKEQIVDQEKFDSLVALFLAKSELKKQHAYILLGKELIAEKVIPTEKQELPEDELKKFFESTKIPDKDLAKNVYQFTNEVHAIAAHKGLYLGVATAFQKQGWTIDAVIPVTIFKDISQEGPLTPDDIELLSQNEKDIKLGDFLNEPENTEETTGQPVKDAPAPTPPPKPQKESLPMFRYVVLGVLSFVVMLGIFLLFSSDIPKRITGSFQQPSPTPVPKETPTPTPEEVAKEVLKVQILNGSGVSGQAGKLKKAMEELGYKDIETGNAKETETITKTTISFSSKVTKTMQNEMRNTLKETLGDVESETAENGAFDITIVTGKKE